MTKMSVNCVLVVISLLVSWFSTSLYVEGKSDKGEERGRGREKGRRRERVPFIMKNIKKDK